MDPSLTVDLSPTPDLLFLCPSKVRDVVGKNPIVLVGTKLDLLPEGTHPKDVAEWLTEAVSVGQTYIME